MCGAHMTRELLHQYRAELKKYGHSNHMDKFTYKIIYCCDQWLAGKRFDISTGSGKSHWTDAPDIKQWWQDNIGELDWPELRVPEEIT